MGHLGHRSDSHQTSLVPINHLKTRECLSPQQNLRQLPNKRGQDPGIQTWLWAHGGSSLGSLLVLLSSLGQPEVFPTLCGVMN